MLHATLADEDCVDCQRNRGPYIHHLVGRVFGPLPGDLVYDMEYAVEGLANCIGDRPASEGFSYGVHVGYARLDVCCDDSIANTLERRSQLLRLRCKSMLRNPHRVRKDCDGKSDNVVDSQASQFRSRRRNKGKAWRNEKVHGH